MLRAKYMMADAPRPGIIQQNEGIVVRAGLLATKKAKLRHCLSY